MIIIYRPNYCHNLSSSYLCKKKKKKKDMTHEQAYLGLLSLVTAITDYELQTPDDYTADDGQPTTAAEFADYLRALPTSLPQKKTSSPRHNPKMTYTEWLNCPDNKDYIHFVCKEARESVDPNYRLCVVDTDIKECYLTDDISVAMEYAAARSKTDIRMWYVCRIIRDCHGSYITILDGYCKDGHYTDGSHSLFLHYDYISQLCAGNVKKI